MKKVILTGDRPTGKLHLGHYIGSLRRRVELQNAGNYDQMYVFMADVQALTDNAENPEKLRQSIVDVALDWLSAGLDPEKCTLFIQSHIPELAELTTYLMNLITVSRVQRNPTVKTEIKMRNFEANIPLGFFCYPVSQAADITILSATAVIHGDMTLGMMLAVQYIIGQLNSPVEQLMGFIYSLQDVKISLERINEIHTTGNEEDDNRTVSQHSDKTKGIALEKASFKYDFHSPKFTLENIDLHIPAGKVTAIVGASGSGKTTLVKLMLGYYPLNEGRLQICGNDIRNINLKWWRRQCGVVMQDGVIFSESIARNIAVDDREIDVERLGKAAEIACIKDYVMSLPLKFNTKIGKDGMGLSQGQKQRILIARAVYKNPDFIFLDEATNALDANNERAIVENLARFYEGKTVVVVAHRLSTVRNAGQIVVLDNGKVVETGNHESLVVAKGAYYHLVKNQLELGN